MEPLNKAIIGQRIKRLRKSKELRQWQMAELLGATQPAVHKYENGILPEVKRLLEIARLGNTSIEWILTGRHWDNGSEQMDRLDPEVYDLAYRLSTLSQEDRRILSEALEIIQSTVTAVRERSGAEPAQMSDGDLARSIKSLLSHGLEPLLAALAVYDAVMTTLSRSKVREMHRLDQPAAAGPKRRPAHPEIDKSAG